MVKHPSLRTPITYYGGKQKLVSTIVPLIPQHNLYCEPFIGGAAVFFGKEPSKVKVINDTNKEVINFYQVCRNRSHDLQSLVKLHSTVESNTMMLSLSTASHICTMKLGGLGHCGC